MAQGRRASSASIRSSCRKINAPAGKAPFGPLGRATSKQAYVTSAFVREALDKGAELFNWDEKKARSGKQRGTKVRGIGVAVSTYTAGSIGFDGLLIIQPDGKRAVPVRHRQPRHALGHRRATASPPRCSTCRGRSARWSGATPAKHLPWTCVSAGSQTTHAMTRAAHAAATDAKQEAAGDRRQDARRQRPRATRWPTAACSAAAAA